MTALRCTVQGGFTEVVKILLKHPGIDVSERNNDETLLSSQATNPQIRSFLTYFERPPTGWTPLFSWLAVRLLSDGLDAQLVRDCEQALVVKEGFALKSDFADLSLGEIDVAYLRSIGVTGKGVQVRLIKLHRELHAQYAEHADPFAVPSHTARSPRAPEEQEAAPQSAISATQQAPSTSSNAVDTQVTDISSYILPRQSASRADNKAKTVSNNNKRKVSKDEDYFEMSSGSVSSKKTNRTSNGSGSGFGGTTNTHTVEDSVEYWP